MRTSLAPKIIYEPTLFKPADAERISGLATGMQRDWRSRGYLPRSGKHARFDAPGVAKLLVMQVLANRTIGPLESRAIAGQCAAAVVTHALLWVDGAWNGDPEAVFDQVPTDAREPTLWEEQHRRSRDRAIEEEQGELARFGRSLEKMLPYSDEERAQFAASRRRRDKHFAADHSHHPNEKREWILSQLHDPARDEWYAGPGAPSEIIWWPTGEVTLGSWQSIRDASTEDDPRLDGAAVVLPVDGLAYQLVKRAGKPLLSVRIETPK